jgi:multidrug transporter EmrE-like cation transporter
MWLWPLTALVLFEILADVFAKQYSLEPTARLWACSILSYIVANIFWLMALRRGAELARGAVLFSVMSAALAMLVGIGLYGEHLTRTRIFGMLLGLLSIILLFWE